MTAPDATRITEVAPDLFRICTYVPAFDMQFSQFLARDDEPLLFHTGMRGLFPAVRDAVAEVLDPRTLRWVAFSHFEADEAGALDDWLALAPAAVPVCGTVGAAVNLADVARRPPRGLAHGEALVTGRCTFRWQATPHLPHGWDAGLLFEERSRALLCSDLLHQMGDVEPTTRDDVVARYRASLVGASGSPFDHSVPHTPRTRTMLEGLAALDPVLLLPMHGSTWRGDGAAALRRLADTLDDVLAPLGAA